MNKKVPKICLIVLLLVISFIGGWSSHIVWNKGKAFVTKIKGDDKFLAADENGNYLGVVIAECRDWETKAILSCKIQQSDGKIIERDANRVKIYAP